MNGIVKRFGSVHALRGADFSCRRGEVHALLGENGAGKTTLMRTLFGMIRPDGGTIRVFGESLPPGSPRSAIAAGLAMVHQHLTLVPRFSVAENVWLGRQGRRYDRRQASALVEDLGRQTGLHLDPQAMAGELSIGLRQRAEIVRALAHSPRVLILDEPTASLTPAEVEQLFAALARLREQGLAVILITHKLREVEALADRITVLRNGTTVLTGPKQAFTSDDLARAMIGSDATAAVMGVALEQREDTSHVRAVEPVLMARGLTVAPLGNGPGVRDASFALGRGEIVGLAAVEGNGQRELMRALVGLVAHGGALKIAGSAEFIPEDRLGEALIADFSVEENLALGSPRGFWLSRARLREQALAVIAAFGIKTEGPAAKVRSLSGGNQQRIVLARALTRRPAVLVAENPARGLDLRATAELHHRIRLAARRDGLAVLYYSTDLDEVLSVSDRVAVMFEGRWREVQPADRNRNTVGLMMLGAA